MYDQRLVSLGIMGDRLRVSLKTIVHHNHIILRGLRGYLNPNFRKALSFSQNSQWSKIQVWAQIRERNAFVGSSAKASRPHPTVWRAKVTASKTPHSVPFELHFRSCISVFCVSVQTAVPFKLYFRSCISVFCVSVFCVSVLVFPFFV